MASPYSVRIGHSPRSTHEAEHRGDDVDNEGEGRIDFIKSNVWPGYQAAYFEMELSSQNPLYVGGFLLVVATISWVYSVLTGPLVNIPGPWYTKWTRYVSVFWIIRAQHPAWVHRLHEIYGPIVRISPYEVDISDLPTVKRIHSVKDGLLKSPFYEQLITDSSSVFNTIYPDVHRKYKRLLSNPMSETGLKAFLPRIDAKMRLAIKRIADENRETGRADVAKWFMFLSFDVIGDLAFGESFGNLERGIQNRSVTDFISLGFVGGLRSMFPLIAKISTVLPVPVFSNATQIQWRTFDYAQRALDRHKVRVDEAGGQDEHPTVFSKIYSAESDETWTPIEIRDNAQVFIVGGSDTTANSMIYLIWSVCKIPHVREMLLKEIQALPEDFSYDDLRDATYLNCCVDEALRLYSALPAGLPRAVPPGGIDLAGHYIPGGMTVTTQCFSLHRNEEVFPDPYAFNPDRWLKTTQLMKDSMMPFGGGARTCLGRHLARIELRLITTRFFRTFPNAKISTVEGMSDKDMEPALHFLMVPSGHRCLIETEG